MTPAYFMVNCAHPSHFDDVLRKLLGGFSVVGGCCGTDHEHVATIARALS